MAYFGLKAVWSKLSRLHDLLSFQQLKHRLQQQKVFWYTGPQFEELQDRQLETNLLSYARRPVRPGVTSSS